MTGSFRIGGGELSVVRNGLVRLNTARRHSVYLSRVVGTHNEPQRNGSRSPAINNNININETITIDECDPGATQLLGKLVITLGSGTSYEPTIPAGKPYSFMGGTFVYAHNYDWFAGYTIFIDNGAVKLRRRIVSTYAPPDSGTLFFNLRAFSIAYSLRAVRFL